MQQSRLWVLAWNCSCSPKLSQWKMHEEVLPVSSQEGFQRRQTDTSSHSHATTPEICQKQLPGSKRKQKTEAGPKQQPGFEYTPTSKEVSDTQPCRPEAKQLLAQRVPSNGKHIVVRKGIVKKSKKTSRRGGKRRKLLSENLTVVGTNANGLNSKKDS